MRIAWKPVAWGLLVFFVLAMLLSILAVRHFWNEALQQNGIETLEWQGLDLSFSGLSVRELTLTQSQPAQDVALHAKELVVNWNWLGPHGVSGVGWLPQLMAVKAEYLTFDWFPKAGEQSKNESAKTNYWPPELPAWLPSDIAVQRFEVTLPCEVGRCLLAGSLSVSSSQPDTRSASVSATHARLPIKAHLQLDHEGHLVNVVATLRGSGVNDLNLSAELAIDGTRYLSAESDYTHPNEKAEVSWRGSVDIPDLPQTDWLLAWAQTWQSFPAEQWPEQPQTGSAGASWQLQWPAGKEVLAQASGSVNIQAQVPQPWPAPGVGHVSGEVAVALDIEQGQWQPNTLKADLQLSHPAGWVKKIPEWMRPEAVTLSIRPAAQIGSEQTRLPLTVELSSRGRANASLRSHLAIATSAPWMVQLGQTQLTASLSEQQPELQVAGWVLTNPRLDIALTGRVDKTAATLNIGEPAVLKVDQIKPAPAATAATTPTPTQDIRLTQLQVDLAKTRLNAQYRAEQSEVDQLTFSGPVGLKAKQIKHPQLLTQPWQFQGKLSSTLARTDVTGLLKANTGTTMNLEASVPYKGPLQLEGNMRVSGEDEADALSRILAAWPPELTVSGGNVSATATYRQPKNGAVQVAGNLVFADWSGTYDRTAWSKMNGSVELLLENNRVRVATPELTVAEINPGMPVGPVIVAGAYQASLVDMPAGTLTLNRLQSGALGGKVQVNPGSWDLANAPVTIPVDVHKLSIARLLQLYPTEGLAGTGILSGTVPILFDPAKGIRIKEGHIDALKPGGRLQLTADRLKALASQNEAMKLVADALEDFRYSVLDSGIDYDQDGTLLLKLHLKGSSPDVGDGRPVVLNINLEENIPALLTSLQLSGRVSDAVAERVKKSLQKQEQGSGDLLE